MPADPKALFYTVSIVIGLLILWVGWVLVKTPTRKDLSPPAPGTVMVKRKVAPKAEAKKVEPVLEEKEEEEDEDEDDLAAEKRAVDEEDEDEDEDEESEKEDHAKS
jgi:hypothetical protein